MELAILSNIEKEISFEIKLVNNEMLDIDKERDEFENYIPFNIIRKDRGIEKLYFNNEAPTFTIGELKTLFKNISRILSTKKENLEMQRFEYMNSEGYFEINIYDTFEKNEIYIEIWINGGYSGHSSYDKGYKFVSEINQVESFIDKLELEMFDLAEMR